MTPQPPNANAIDAALDALLARQPALPVVAIDAIGTFVPMPPCVPVQRDRVVVGPKSGLQLVVSSDIQIVIEIWSRALREGIAADNVHLLGRPGDEVVFSIVDARNRYGVLLGFLDAPNALASVNDDPAHIVYHAMRPPRWTLKKDGSGLIIDVDPAVTESLGWLPDEMIGRRSLEFIHPKDWARVTANWMDMMAGGTGCRARLRHKHRDGSWVWFELRNDNQLNDPAQGYVNSEMTDISEEMAALVGEETLARERVEKELVNAAFRDPLTELPNRSLFVDRLRLALQTQRAGASGLAVLLLDCDRFQSINNSFGHVTGDLLLVALARRFQDALRGSDTIARLGGDEFGVLIEGTADDAVTLAQRMLAGLSEPFALAGMDLYVRASIGIATSAEGSSSADEMLRDADIAMYQAKARGRHRCELFHVGLRDRATRTTQLEMALRQAIERNELAVHYQPIVALAQKRVVGFEALLRWRHPQIGAVLPMEFIPIAEETGLIFEIGEWVLHEACRQIQVFRETLPGYDKLSVNVNVSLAQFRRPGFVESVDGALSVSGLPARSLHLELTESLLMEDLAGLKAILVQLRERGVAIHIDDFGTGYSSLAYLDQLAVQTLKIDKSFISRTGDELANAQIVETILNLARQLGVSVTAEGIETAEQERRLRALDCETGQGYLYSQPLRPEHVGAFIANWDSALSCP